MSTSRRALIVEDLDLWQTALSEVLVEAGYQVCIARNRTEALAALAQSQFHLAVIDPVLDDSNRRNRDGLRVLRHILDQQPNTAVVVVTSSDPNRIRREVHQLSPHIPLLWKDRWDDDHFLTLVQNLYLG